MHRLNISDKPWAITCPILVVHHQVKVDAGSGLPRIPASAGGGG